MGFWGRIGGNWGLGGVSANRPGSRLWDLGGKTVILEHLGGQKWSFGGKNEDLGGKRGTWGANWGELG